MSKRQPSRKAGIDCEITIGLQTDIADQGLKRFIAQGEIIERAAAAIASDIVAEQDRGVGAAHLIVICSRAVGDGDVARVEQDPPVFTTRCADVNRAAQGELLLA